MFRFLFKAAVNHEWEGLMKEKLAELEGNQIAVSGDGNQLFLAFSQMDEFCFLEFTIVGPYQTKTFKGANSTFVSANSRTCVCASDTQEIDTDFSVKQRIGITQIDVDLTDELMSFIQNNKLIEIHFEIEKQIIQFNEVDEAKFTAVVHLAD